MTWRGSSRVQGLLVADAMDEISSRAGAGTPTLEEVVQRVSQVLASQRVTGDLRVRQREVADLVADMLRDDDVGTGTLPKVLGEGETYV